MKSKRLELRVTPEEKESIKREASLKGLSMSEYIIERTINKQ